ncbi:unnamed protein product [Mytilus coruscus]|uniref:C-type lectin domain-containing protein n=1 Tax=Mytilus coruscus TaxID=42192 RepID=A0A6J8F2L5_MYTCO|nr:unnamed protein product [Mytilus coruscus]
MRNMIKLHSFGLTLKKRVSCALNAYFVQYFPHQDIWFDAQKFCNDTGGRLATNEDSGDELSCNKLKGRIDSNGLTYWTGKYKTISHWISRIGCFEILRNPTVLPAHSVSRCYEVCRMQHTIIKLFAHIEHKCVCLTENIQSLEKIGEIRQCNQTLNSDNNFLAYIDSFASLPWNKSEERCKYHIPGTIEDICKPMTIGHPGAWLPIHRVTFWTEVTLDGVTMEETEYVTECQSYRCYNNEATPHLANTSCSEKTTGFFCAFSSSNNMTTDRMKTFTESAVLFPGTYSFKSTNLKDHGSNVRTLNEDRFTGLIVGGVLGAFIIVGVVILVVILALRRRKASTKNQNVEQIEISDEDQQRKTLSNNIRVNQLYEDEGAHESRLVPVRTKETECANEQEGKKSNDVYAVVMKNNMTTPLQVGINSVVASEDAAESEYDRLNITPKVLTDNMEYNLYDSSKADRCESDPTYNTATTIRHSRKNTDDVYD